MDCVSLRSVSEFAGTKIMLCGLKNMKSMCYTKVTWASKNLLLIFNTSFTEIKSSELRYLIEFDCPIIFVRVLFTASIIKLHR